MASERETPDLRFIQHVPELYVVQAKWVQPETAAHVPEQRWPGTWRDPMSLPAKSQFKAQYASVVVCQVMAKTGWVKAMAITMQRGDVMNMVALILEKKVWALM